MICNKNLFLHFAGLYSPFSIDSKQAVKSDDFLSRMASLFFLAWLIQKIFMWRLTRFLIQQQTEERVVMKTFTSLLEAHVNIV